MGSRVRKHSSQMMLHFMCSTVQLSASFSTFLRLVSFFQAFFISCVSFSYFTIFCYVIFSILNSLLFFLESQPFFCRSPLKIHEPRLDLKVINAASTSTSTTKPVILSQTPTKKIISFYNFRRPSSRSRN